MGQGLRLEADSSDDEHFVDVDKKQANVEVAQAGADASKEYDAFKREPLYCNAAASQPYELLALC